MRGMISPGRVFAAGAAGLFVSLVVAASAGLLLFASALGSLDDSGGDGGNGDGTFQVAAVGLLVLIVGVVVCAGAIRLSLGGTGRGRRLLMLLTGSALFVGTLVLLGGAIVIRHAITGGAGVLWLPLGPIASLVYLFAWAAATTGFLSGVHQPS
jgi:hypothetical protein